MLHGYKSSTCSLQKKFGQIKTKQEAKTLTILPTKDNHF